MKFTEQELAMLAVLRGQRDGWPALRGPMVFMSVFLLAGGGWELHATGWNSPGLLLLLVGVMSASFTYRNWNGPPEATLLLKLIDRIQCGEDA